MAKLLIWEGKCNISINRSGYRNESSHKSINIKASTVSDIQTKLKTYIINEFIPHDMLEGIFTFDSVPLSFGMFGCGGVLGTTLYVIYIYTRVDRSITIFGSVQSFPNFDDPYHPIS